MNLSSITQVTTAKLVDSAVTTSKISDSAVTTAKIADGAVTGIKLAAGAVIPVGISGLLKATSGVVSQAVAGTDYLTSSSGGSLTLATAQTASGTSVDFTGIPSWVKRITVMLNGVSSNASSYYLIRVGTSSSIITSGYSSYCNTFNSAPSGSPSTSGFLIIEALSAPTTLYGNLTIIKMSNDTWAASGTLGDFGSTAVSLFGGGVTFAGTLDRIRLTTVNGTDTFDAGTINIIYE